MTLLHDQYHGDSQVHSPIMMNEQKNPIGSLWYNGKPAHLATPIPGVLLGKVTVDKAMCPFNTLVKHSCWYAVGEPK